MCVGEKEREGEREGESNRTKNTSLGEPIYDLLIRQHRAYKYKLSNLQALALVYLAVAYLMPDTNSH
jgi:hypothetical protein